jgi:hypothetical protein
MGLMTTLGTGQGYLKAGFQGFNKSGKTFTATRLAIGTRRHFGLKGPIGFFDTEGGSEYVAATVKKDTGLDLVGKRSRSIDDLMVVTQECIDGAASVLVVDSMSHIWKDVLDSYLRKINEVRTAKGKPARSALEFQDWGPLKAKFNKFTDLYLNSPLHIIICGRAQYTYDYETNEETGKKELMKTGIKMRTEAEFGFEPSLLVEMERVQNLTGEGSRLVHRATVIGDRFSVLDGKTVDNPTEEFFQPYLDCLKSGAHAPIDMSPKTDPEVNGEGDSAFYAERRAKAIACEKIAAELDKAWAGTSAAAKKGRADAIDKAFGTRSWTEVEGMKIERLRDGFKAIREMVTAVPAATEGA